MCKNEVCDGCKYYDTRAFSCVLVCEPKYWDFSDN